MIHYHGTPVGGNRSDVLRLLQGRHALVPYPRKDDLGCVADVCKSFVFDNGAFSVWRKGGTLDVEGYKQWVKDWCKHPGFSWALIPDVIEGTDEENNVMINDWNDSGLYRYGVPVYHLHESVERLKMLANIFPTVALGSSGQYSKPNSKVWWGRMKEVMDAVCDEQGRPMCKLHGLRMLDPRVFTKLPLTSADSTNAAVNGGSVSRFGMYTPPTAGQRAEVIANRIEQHNSSAIWERTNQTEIQI